LKIKYKFLIFFLALPLNLFSDQTDEGVELLYQKISELEKEIAELRSQLEENSVLVERSLELQQQRYLDLDSRMLELSSNEKNIVSESSEESLAISYEQEEKLLYKNALELFEASRYAEALEIFSEVIISYPDGIYTPDAYFWSGELFLTQGLYEDAKLSYAKVFEQFPDHVRSADSLYKLGEIYRIDSDLIEATNYYERVISLFPDSGAAQLSKKSIKIITEESNLID
jgi:tol-pal system protein YbgF|tara:strand:+ start:1969 stop:2655 length:687 start_codon:yes stop_codon:yes gene_type:complete